MPRFIELPNVADIPPTLALRTGDVALIHAGGARIDDKTDVVELRGPLVWSSLGVEGKVLAPSGVPNVFLLRALRPGDANIQLATLIGFQIRESRAVHVDVRP